LRQISEDFFGKFIRCAKNKCAPAPDFYVDIFRYCRYKKTSYFFFFRISGRVKKHTVELRKLSGIARVKKTYLACPPLFQAETRPRAACLWLVRVKKHTVELRKLTVPARVRKTHLACPPLFQAEKRLRAACLWLKKDEMP
jgi:hypothetical protein